MESIEKHIEKDKEILQNPLTSPQNVATLKANCTI